MQTVSFTAYASISTNAIGCLFVWGLKNISDSTLTHVYQYRYLIMNGFYYIYKTSHHHIKKTNFTKLPWCNSFFRSSLYTRFLTSGDTEFSRGPGFGRLHSLLTSDQHPSWYNPLPANFLARVIFSPASFAWTPYYCRVWGYYGEPFFIHRLKLCVLVI